MWEKFDVKNWSESGSIYCDTCALKNRGDTGWWYRIKTGDSLFQKNKEHQERILRSILTSSTSGDINLQRNEYTCNYCIAKHNLKYVNIENLPITTLKKYLKQIYKSVDGTKPELVSRLKEYMT